MVLWGFMSYVPWYACSLNFIRTIPDRLSYNGEGVFYTQRTRRKKIQGKKKREKSKAGKTERAGKRRTENDKERNGKSHKFSQLRTIRAVFFIQKSPSHVKRVFFGCEAIFKIPANTLRAWDGLTGRGLSAYRKQGKIHSQLTCLLVFF